MIGIIITLIPSESLILQGDIHQIITFFPSKDIAGHVDNVLCMGHLYCIFNQVLLQDTNVTTCIQKYHAIQPYGEIVNGL